MADFVDEGFGDFKFAPRSFSNGGSHINFGFNINGSFTSSHPPPPPPDADDYDDDWGDFMGPSSRSQPTPDSSSLQFNLFSSNGFFPSQPPQPTATAFDPFGFRDSSSARSVEPKSVRIEPESKRVGFEKPKGALPLSLFGEEEEEGGGGKEEERGGSVINFPANGSNGVLHQKPSAAVVNGNSSNLDVDVSEILANLYAQSRRIKYDSGSNSDSNGVHTVSKSDTDLGGTKEGFDDEDDWEFQGAFSGNGSEENFKDGGSKSSGSDGESVAAIGQDQKAGQDASKFVVNNLGSINSPHQFADIFTAQNKVTDKNEEVNVGTDFRATALSPDGFISFPHANGLEIGNANVTYATPENMNDDFNDFGEFINAASEPGSKHQNYHATHEAPAQAHVQDENVADHSLRPESHRQPLLDSIFGNGVVESNDDHRSVVDGPTVIFSNGTTFEGPEKTIHDIISNLYNQDQHTASVDSSKKPTENGAYATQKTSGLGSVNDWSYFDKKSWGFKDEAGINESSVLEPNDAVKKLSVKLQDLQIFDFYARLRDKLYFLALSLLEDAEGREAKEARLSLQSDMESEVHMEKNMQINSCLSEFIDVLHGAKFELIESEYLMSRRLPLAEKDWKVAIELLKETRLIIKILASGSDNDQSAYISIWSDIVNACAEELRRGALIWKQAVDNSLQIQILSDHRGQRYIQALGEIYRVGQLLGLSAKVYKPWMLSSKEDQLSLFLALDECSALWSSSGLEEAFWNLLGADDSAPGNAVEALFESIKHIQEIDVLAVLQDCALLQQRSICQLSLLPELMLPELKFVSWNGEKYFLNVANLWANLISHDPPSLPHLNVG